jgi:P-type Cu2+ transporter
VIEGRLVYRRAGMRPPERERISMSRAESHHHHHKGHDQHAGHSPKMFRDKFWLSFALTLPVVFWSEHIEELLGYQAPEFPGASWIPPVLATAIFLYGGLVFLQGAWRELSIATAGDDDADLPGHLRGLHLLLGRAPRTHRSGRAVVGACHPGDHHAARSLDRDALDLAGSGRASGVGEAPPGHGDSHHGETEETVPVSELHEGDVVLVRPGERVPADGIVRKGESALNEAMLTGESRPVKKKEGDEVIAATINGEGSLRVEITGTGTRPSCPASCDSWRTPRSPSRGRNTWPTARRGS